MITYVSRIIYKFYYKNDENKIRKEVENEIRKEVEKEIRKTNMEQFKVESRRDLRTEVEELVKLESMVDVIDKKQKPKTFLSLRYFENMASIKYIVINNTRFKFQELKFIKYESTDKYLRVQVLDWELNEVIYGVEKFTDNQLFLRKETHDEK